MFSENEVKKLIIVCTKETEKYGAYLMQLVSLKDDSEIEITGLKDGSVEAVLWNEKEYIANRPQLPASSFVLFIGSSKLMMDEASNMEECYNEFGIHFLSLGTHAVMYVEQKLLGKKDYDAFIAMCDQNKKNMEKRAKLNILNTAHPAVKWIGTLFAPVVYPAFIYGLVSGNAAKKKINDQQYSFLTFHSYMELLPKFLGNKE